VTAAVLKENIAMILDKEKVSLNIIMAMFMKEILKWGFLMERENIILQRKKRLMKGSLEKAVWRVKEKLL
jgi:hypothetical protein